MKLWLVYLIGDELTDGKLNTRIKKEINSIENFYLKLFSSITSPIKKIILRLINKDIYDSEIK